MPFIARIAERATPRAWDAVEIEDEFPAAMILPELGGPIRRETDKANGWWTLVAHRVDGGFCGDPFDDKPRRPCTLWAMADDGSGPPTGAIACNEDALPAEYRGDLFLCEWAGKELLRLRLARQGGTYEVDVCVQTGGLDFLSEVG